MDDIDNQNILLYIKDILFKAIQQNGLSNHFTEIFEGQDDPLKNARDLNPEEFRD